MVIARSSLLTVTSTRVRYRCSITGEDDLDAPDFDAGANPAAEPPRPSDQRKQSHGQAAAAQRAAAGGGKLPRPSARSILGEQPSATLRESLIQQMAARSAEDETAAWAHRSLPAKKHPDNGRRQNCRRAISGEPQYDRWGQRPSLRAVCDLWSGLRWSGPWRGNGRSP